MFAKRLIIGHRGAAAYAPENTLAAFKTAQALGCRWVEFDVMLSSDGEPFIFHDESLSRTTNGTGDMGLSAADYVRSLDAGSWFATKFSGETIPTLRETLIWLGNNMMQANIEIKPYPGTVEQTTEQVLQHIHDYWPKNAQLPLISSFDLDALRLCHRLKPNLPRGVLFQYWQPHAIELANALSCFSIHLPYRAVTKARIDAVHEAGFKLCVYTVNHPKTAMRLFDMGVDALFSDYPDILSSFSV